MFKSSKNSKPAKRSKGGGAAMMQQVSLIGL
jgi:hypothetical protein